MYRFRALKSLSGIQRHARRIKDLALTQQLPDRMQSLRFFDKGLQKGESGEGLRRPDAVVGGDDRARLCKDRVGVEGGGVRDEVVDAVG